MIDSPLTGNNKRVALDWFDRKVLQYVLFWAPFGDMDDEDVFPEFGMRVDQLNERFDSIVSTLSGRSSNFDDGDRDLPARARRLQLSGRVEHGGHHGPRPIPRHRRGEWRAVEKCAHSTDKTTAKVSIHQCFQLVQDVPRVSCPARVALVGQRALGYPNDRRRPCRRSGSRAYSLAPRPCPPRIWLVDGQSDELGCGMAAGEMVVSCSSVSSCSVSVCLPLLHSTW